MRIITVDDVKDLIRKVTLEKFFVLLVGKLTEVLQDWESYLKMPRIVSYAKSGVMELMPFWGEDYYSFKYVNGHPKNPQIGKQTVVALGMLADTTTGYPICLSEMTVLTALRTAATSALAARFLAKKNSKCFAIIGTGAQSEFQVLAHHVILGINKVQYFDIDPHAMAKFQKNLSSFHLDLQACTDNFSTIKNADIITLATAEKKRAEILSYESVKPGVMINAIGGDSIGKTELDPKILEESKIVVEYFEQAKVEGEIQNLKNNQVYAELWELVQNKKPGRTNNDEIFVFDSVGFALEDHAILKLIYSLAEDFQVGHMLDMLPETKDPKDLFGMLV